MEAPLFRGVLLSRGTRRDRAAVVRGVGGEGALLEARVGILREDGAAENIAVVPGKFRVSYFGVRAVAVPEVDLRGHQLLARLDETMYPQRASRDIQL